MTYEYVLTATHDGIGTITLNRPDKLNAFAGTMRQEIADAVRAMARDDTVHVLVVTGAGRAFCAGADIGYMRELTETRDVEGFRQLVDAGRQVVSVIRATEKPVIASVNGAAAGGGANLALACDLRIASNRASMGQTFTRIGMHPDWGGTYFLPRLVGPSKALELMLGGEMIDAAEAQRLGLFNRVVPHDRLAADTDAWARQLTAQPPLALARVKHAVYQSDTASLQAMLDLELEHQLECFASDDAQEGFRAFLEKRAPTFKGQ